MIIKQIPFTTPYTEEKVKMLLGPWAGVYLLYTKEDDRIWKCFHIGRTDNLIYSLLHHISTDEHDTIIKENVKKTCGFQCSFATNLLKGKCRELVLDDAYIELWNTQKSKPIIYISEEK